MKALVTGGTGFLGSALVRALAVGGHSVRVLARPRSDRRALAGVAGLEIVEGDLRDPASLVRAVAGADVVFHAAGLYALWVKDEADFFEVNVRGAEALMRAAKDAKVSRVVHTSTTATIGIDESGGAASEDATFNLGSYNEPYTNSKREGEARVLAMAKEGLPVVVVNPSAPVGEWDWKPTPTGELVLKFMKRQIPFYSQGGLSPVDAADVVRGHLLALERGRVGERDILAGENMTYKEIFGSLEDVTGLRAPLLPAPPPLVNATGWAMSVFSRATGLRVPLTRAAARLASVNMFFSSDKAKRDLGYTISPLRGQGGALARACAWYRANGYVKSR